MNLATRCTGCGTVFRVVQDQLRVSAGWVRCGRCGAVFNAIESLVDVVADGSSPAPGAPATPAATRERVMQDLRRVAGPALGAAATSALGNGGQEPTQPVRAMATEDPVREVGIHAPEVAGDAGRDADDGATAFDEAVDETIAGARRPASFEDGGDGDDGSDDGLPGTDMVDVDALSAPRVAPHQARHEVTGAVPDELPGELPGQLLHGATDPTHDQGRDESPDGVADELSRDQPPAEVVVPAPVPAFLRRAERAARWRQPWVRALLALLAVAGAAGLLAQAALWQHDQLAARWPAAAPALTRLCGWAGCTVGPPRQLDGLAVLSSTLVRDDAPGRYRLGVTLRNRATTVVRMPAFELTLSDARGRLIVRRVLQAGDLGADRDHLEPGAELVLEAALLAGTEPIVGYTIEIFYP